MVREDMQSLPLQDVDLVLVPCHVGGSHWTLLAIDIANRHVQYYDSLRGKPCPGLVHDVLEYVKAEAQRQKDFFREGHRDIEDFDMQTINWSRTNLRKTTGPTAGCSC